MQMSAITPATAQRVASLKSSSSNSSLSTPSPPTRTASTTSSRLTAQTASSAQKQADASLRGRGQLPTIAGSPSVGITHASREPKDMPPPSLLNAVTGNVKETPTRIPRISSRTSAVGSPTLKHSGLIERRASLNVSGFAAGSTDPSPTPGEASINEFGVIENGDKSVSKPIPATHRQSTRGSPSSRAPRQATATSSGAPTPRKSNRDSVTFGGLRKTSIGSVASTSSVAPSESHHRFSALSPSKGFKMLTPKMSLPAARSSASQSVHHGNSSPSSSRQSLSTPSPSPSSIDEEELLGDEEMMHYIRRQQTKKVANGASQKELDDLLAFPDPLPPSQPSSPQGMLSQFDACS
jgi:dual specificity tyrosine-phosphorylation-regulated kinase 2/3/4